MANNLQVVGLKDRNTGGGFGEWKMTRAKAKFFTAIWYGIRVRAPL